MLRVLFAGSPDIAIPSLVRLSFEQEIVGILTNPDMQKGRGLSMSQTPVAEAALAVFHGDIPILAFERLGSEAREAVAALKPDILVSYAYGKIFGPRFLALFPKGGVNVHPSLLPKYRGPAPIPYAILNRESETGICVQRLAVELDTGDLLGVDRIRLLGLENAEDLAETAAIVGADLLSRVLQEIDEGKAKAEPQVGEPSYCQLLRKEDGMIDWKRPVLDIDAKVRAFYPWPGAFTFLGGQRLSILEAYPYPHVTFAAGATSLDFDDIVPGRVLGLDKARGIMVQTNDGLMALRRLQIQHKRALPYREFANGIRDLVGAVLGGPSPEGSDSP